MDQIQPQNLRCDIELFEGLITAALQEKYEPLCSPGFLERFLQLHPISHWKLLTFFDTYIQGKVFPIDRLERLMNYLFDIKLQTYYVLEVYMGSYNRLDSQGYDRADPKSTPHFFLSKLSLEQSLVGKTRILWERYMNFIYFLETGVNLEDTVRKRSKKTVFSNLRMPHHAGNGLQTMRTISMNSMITCGHPNSTRCPLFERG